MDKLPPYAEWSRDVRWIPTIDGSVKFFGAHEQAVRRDWRMPKESHVGFELILILEGVQETVMEGSRYELREGDILVIPPGFRHVNRCASEGGMRYFCAHFNVDEPEFCRSMIKHGRMLFPAGTTDNAVVRGIAGQWIAMLRRDGGNTAEDRFRVQALLFELLGALARIVSEPPGGKPDPNVPPAAVHYAKAMAEAMKSRLATSTAEAGGPCSVKIEEIASMLGISPGYAQEVFRSVYQISPRRYLSELKLHEAKVLMQQPGLALQDIASRLGYADLSHFSRQFKRWTGQSPLQYRRSVMERKADGSGEPEPFLLRP
ncbi:helix-turn-helix domain-containing protein [Cohnella thermotolerans]|uniref:helix-turn-helix domain-containing protein n=1 Tax=Cohnella thermotolerans TaxID=329858 RepID=UPI0004198851|nr:AraC family transcriptional regulator [Cohnella thermotolerans]